MNDSVNADALTPRRQAVLDELCLGKSNKEIADALGLNVESVRGHLKEVYWKMGVSSRTAAVVKVLNGR